MILNRLQQMRSSLDRQKRRRSYRRKIRKILASLDVGQVASQVGEMTVSKYRPGYRNRDWHVAYAAAGGIVSPHYLPEDLFYTEIEPRLNNPDFLNLYSHKVNLGFLLGESDYIGFDFFIRRGVFYDRNGAGTDFATVKDWILAQDEVVFKPFEVSGGGRGVSFLRGSEAVDHAAGLDHGVMLQNSFRQHPDIAAMQPHSVNTMRIMTLRMNGRIHIVSTVLRMGIGRSRIDNATRGGVVCGIRDGAFREIAYDVKMRRYETHPTSGAGFRGRNIPSWPEVESLVIRCHGRVQEADLVSWDVAVREDGIPQIIEANVRSQEIGGPQVCNGPVFEPFLEYLLQG